MTLPKTMTAIAITTPGGPDALQPRAVPMPVPGPGQLLVKVAAAGVNRPDVAQRAGSYPPPPGHSPIPGLEMAGTVVAAGEGVTRYKAGDQVTALLNGGGYAEYAIAEQGAALPVPKGLDMISAGAIPETFFTVWHNVFERGGLKGGEWLLVHGGSSGIGTTAIQLAKAFGASVAATAGSDAKCQACRDLGADLAINYKSEDFVAAVKSATGGKGAELVLDMVGGSYIDRNLDAVASDGRIVQIAFLEGSKADLDFTRLMMKRVTYTGSTLRIRTNAFKAGLAQALEAKVWPLLTQGKVKVPIDATFPLAKAADAHRRMETSAHVGKIVLTV
ncbi:MAG: NAD(P)H-quinone oxidoreductase [Hyphomicrobiaceae bacterium]